MIGDALSDANHTLYEEVYGTYAEERSRLPEHLRTELGLAMEALNRIRAKIDEYQILCMTEGA